LIQNGKNLGLGAALNQGIRSAFSNPPAHLLLLDQDTILNPGYVSRLLSALESNQVGEKIGIIHGVPDSDDFALPFSLFPLKILGGIGKVMSRKKISGDISEVLSTFISGSLIEPIILKSVRFREEFFVDEVDTDFCYEVRKRGYRILVCESALMSHRGGKLVNLHGKQFLYEPSSRFYLIVRNSTMLLREGRRTWPSYIYNLVMHFTLLMTVEGPRSAVKSFFLGLRDGIQTNPLSTSTFHVGHRASLG
jgi:rhamnosyltransferase